MSASSGLVVTVPGGASIPDQHLRRVNVKAKLYTDGGSRGNPGPAAYAYVLEAEDGTVLDARGETIGVATNNVAEYSALVAGLERAVDVGVDALEVISDSELLVKQMRGEYKVKNRALQELFLDASRLARRIHRVTYTAVRREHNELADSLVNEALDEPCPEQDSLPTGNDPVRQRFGLRRVRRRCAGIAIPYPSGVQP